ncbi:MAG: BON domain-containing protein [Balneolales bacterium]
MKTDEEIKVDVVDQLHWDARIDASDVSVRVDNGIVELSGHVPARKALKAAEDDAYMVNGVLSVENNLSIFYPESKKLPTDEDIQNNIESNLAFNSDLESYKIAAEVDDGWVTLHGTVSSYWEEIEAEHEAFYVDGVLGVSSKVAVVPTGSFRDEDIAEDVVNALDRNMYANPDDIEVKVESGEVTLDGMVGSIRAKNAAYNSALYTPGVTFVNNQIKVSRERVPG